MLLHPRSTANGKRRNVMNDGGGGGRAGAGGAPGGGGGATGGKHLKNVEEAAPEDKPRFFTFYNFDCIALGYFGIFRDLLAILWRFFLFIDPCDVLGFWGNFFWGVLKRFFLIFHRCLGYVGIFRDLSAFTDVFTPVLAIFWDLWGIFGGFSDVFTPMLAIFRNILESLGDPLSFTDVFHRSWQYFGIFWDPWGIFWGFSNVFFSQILVIFRDL